MNMAAKTNDDVSYIQFGRAEAAAREAAMEAAQKREAEEYERKIRQAQNKASANPSVSQINRTTDYVREGSMPSAYNPRSSDTFAYAAPYAGTFGTSALKSAKPASAPMYRAASMSAKLREKNPAVSQKSSKSKAKLCPTQFFAAAAVLIGLIFAISIISSWEAEIARNINQGTQQEFVRSNELFQKGANPLQSGDALKACAAFLASAIMGLVGSAVAWRTSSKICVGAACACYIAAGVFRPQFIGVIVAPLIFSVLSLWIFYLNGKAKAAKKPTRKSNNKPISRPSSKPDQGKIVREAR